MKKTKNNIISRWWALAQPSKKHLFGQIFYLTCFTVTLPILTTCTEKLNTLFDNSSNIENMRVDVDRVNLILNLSDE